MAVGVLALDQLTKWWAVNELKNGRIVDVVWTLRFNLTFNYGAAFSLNQGRGVLISVLALGVVAVLLRSGRHARRPAAAIALGMVLGGAIGNLSDRAFRAGDGFLGGGVVDFIDFQWWPVFNVADMGVVCGAFLLLAANWRDEAERERAERAETEAGGDAEAGSDAEAEAGRGDGAGDTARSERSDRAQSSGTSGSPEAAL